MIRLGLIGYPLSHSRSPGLYTRFFSKDGISEAEYRLFPLPHIDQLPELLEKEPELCGFNVTIPHKQSILPFLDRISDTALATGAVNTVAVDRTAGQPCLTGYNTDVDGFELMLENAPLESGMKALILGTGGASKAVQAVLRKTGIPFRLVSRCHKEHVLTYGELSADIIQEHRIIINTTPLGMYPDVNGCPELPWHAVSAVHILLDLVYHPADTRFMQNGTKCGAFVMNGLPMLEKQAEKAWEIFKMHLNI